MRIRTASRTSANAYRSHGQLSHIMGLGPTNQQTNWTESKLGQETKTQLGFATLQSHNKISKITK